MTEKEFKDLKVESNRRLAEIAERAKSANAEEMEKLIDEKNEILARVNRAMGEMSVKIGDAHIEDEITNEMEQRGKDLKDHKEVRFNAKDMMTRYATTDGILPAHQDTKLNNPDFTTVSRLYDGLNAMSIPNGESFEFPFAKTYNAEGEVVAEGTANQNDLTIAFDSIKIGKEKIVAYFEVSEEFLKLPAVDYANFLRKEATNALKRKITGQVVLGDGTGAFKGILDASSAKTIPTTSDKTVAVDGDFLRNVQYSYGFDEEIENATYLALNKATLNVLGLIKANSGAEHTYDIDVNAKRIVEHGTNVGSPYVISSAISSSASASTGGYIGFYGDLSAYTLVFYSDIVLAESRDYKFKEGMVCYRATCIVGGAPTKFCGLMRIKK